MAQGPSDTTAIAEETSRELSLVLPSEGHHPPTRDEPPLRWVSPWDSLSELFTLDDAAEGMEREKLSEGFMTTLEALNQASGALRDVIIPTGRVFTWSCLSISFFFIYFCFLTATFFSLLLLAAERNLGSFMNTRRIGTASSMRHGCTGT